jgi:hypothetical protein
MKNARMYIYKHTLRTLGSKIGFITAMYRNASKLYKLFIFYHVATVKISFVMKQVDYTKSLNRLNQCYIKQEDVPLFFFFFFFY